MVKHWILFYLRNIGYYVFHHNFTYIVLHFNKIIHIDKVIFVGQIMIVLRSLYRSDR